MNAWQANSGSVLVEFAIFASMLMLVFSGIVDYSIFLHHQMELTEAAAAGASFGIIPGNQENTAGMKAAAVAAAPDVSGLQVTASYLYTCTPGGSPVSSTSNCSNYGTPIMYVKVVTSATVPAALRWTGIASSLALGATATYRVPWTR